MEFKEKLYKTHHKRAYYRTRQFLMSFLIVISAGIAISVPTYLSLNKNNNPLGSKAQENEVVENDDNVTASQNYLVY